MILILSIETFVGTKYIIKLYIFLLLRVANADVANQHKNKLKRLKEIYPYDI